MIPTKSPRFIYPLLSTLSLLLLTFSALAQETVSPEQALARLVSGNERFIKGQTLEKHYLADRPALAESQHPYAIVLTCADSRLSPEAIFDESLGKIFVVRVAGNVADPIILGSIEYAAEHLHAPLLIVMGHESCGAVKAAVSNSPVPPNIAQIVQKLRPAVDKVRIHNLNEAQMLNAVIKENVRYQVKMMEFESDVLSEMAHHHSLKIVGAVYNLHTGKVEFLPEGEAQAKDAKVLKEAEKPEKTDHAEKAEKIEKAEAKASSEKNVPVKEIPKASTGVSKTTSENSHSAPKQTSTKKVTASSEKKTGHSTGDGDEAMLHVLPVLTEPAANTKITFKTLPFTEKLRVAYEKGLNVTVTKTSVMRNSKDQCLSPDCRTLAAGANVKMDSPYLLEILGHPNIRVRQGRQIFYLPADEQSLTFSASNNTNIEGKNSLLTQVLATPTKLMSALPFLSKH